MKTYVIVIAADAASDSRKICEQIENRNFSNFSDIKELDGVEYGAYELTDFMDVINNGDLYVDESFITYVHKTS